MAFTVEITEDKFPVISLKDEAANTTVEVYAFGALLNKFIIDDINIIDAFSSPQDAMDNITNGFKSVKLSPYVCRTENGKFEFDGKQYLIGKFFLNKETIHGLLYDAIFDVVEYEANNDHAFVTLHYHFKNAESFPFDYSCVINYQLEENNKLTLITTIRNNSNKEMPLCDGWHPYFTLGSTVDELTFEMNANKMLEFNKRLLPTGNIVDFNQFQKPETIQTTTLDNCFVLNDTSKTSCILKNEKTGLQLAIQADKSYPYLQVYTPPHRKSIAIENLSAAPDALNNKIGLQVLNPGEETTFTTTYTVTK